MAHLKPTQTGSWRLSVASRPRLPWSVAENRACACTRLRRQASVHRAQAGNLDMVASQSLTREVATAANSMMRHPTARELVSTCFMAGFPRTVCRLLPELCTMRSSRMPTISAACPADGVILCCTDGCMVPCIMQEPGSDAVRWVQVTSMAEHTEDSLDENVSDDAVRTL